MGTMKYISKILMCSLFALSGYLPDSKNIYKIKLLQSKIQNYNQYTVRPVVTGSGKSVFISSKKEETSGIRPKSIINSKTLWISAFDTWTNMPLLTEYTEIKIENATEKTQIHFLIQNTKSGKIYITPSKTFWPRNIVDGYFKKLNENINAKIS